MTLDHFVPLFSAAISFVGLMLVLFQLRTNNKQRQLESLVEVYNINRQLITLGFSHRVLFDIMADAQDTDQILERRYLQLWLNQFSLIYSYMYESFFKRELKESLVRDISEFIAMENMQRHWRHHGSFYPVPFQKFVNDIIKKNEPPAAAQMNSGC